LAKPRLLLDPMIGEVEGTCHATTSRNVARSVRSNSGSGRTLVSSPHGSGVSEWATG
jgi:hypothetical protein